MYRTDLPEERVFLKARKRVNDKKGVFIHFVTYASVIGFIYMINQFTSPHVDWWVFPAGGWGIGLAIHYATVFGIFGFGSRDWEERQLEKEIERIEEEEGYLYEYDDIDDTLDLRRPEVLKRSRESDF